MKSDIEKAIETLKRGGVILYPTDTIWGLGCDATNDKAVQKIYKIKKRKETKAMVVLVNSVDKINNYIDKVPELALELIQSSNQPTTIIYENAQNLAPTLIGADNSIAIRVTNEIFSKELCKTFGKPIVSTSANTSGLNAPRNFSEISQEILLSVDYIVRYGQNDNQPKTPSSIVKIENKEIKIIRK